MASSSPRPEETVFPLDIVPGHAASQASAEHETETDTPATSTDLESERGRTQEAEGRGEEVQDMNAVKNSEDHGAFEAIPEGRDGEQDRGSIPTVAVNEYREESEGGREDSTAADYTAPRSPIETRSPGETLSFARMQHYETTAEAAEAEQIYQQGKQEREAGQNHRQESMVGGQQGGAAGLPFLVQGSPRSVYRRRDSRAVNPQTGVAAVVQKRNLKLNVMIIKRGQPKETKTFSRQELLSYVRTCIHEDEKQFSAAYDAWQSSLSPEKGTSADSPVTTANNTANVSRASSPHSSTPASPTLSSPPASRRRTVKPEKRPKQAQAQARDGGRQRGGASGAGPARRNRPLQRPPPLGRSTLDEREDAVMPSDQLPLQARDLRSLDTANVHTSEPFIAVRRFAIVFRIDPYRAIILRNQCILVLVMGMDSELEAIEAALPLGSDITTGKPPLEAAEARRASQQQQDSAGAPQEEAKKSPPLLPVNSTAAGKSRPDDKPRPSQPAGLSVAGVMGLAGFGLAGKTAAPTASPKPKSKAKATFIEPGVPFEFQALSLLFDATVSRIATQKADLEPKVKAVLKELRTARGHWVTVQLEQLRILKNDASILLSTLERLESALDDVLEDDTELKFMQLSRLVESPSKFSIKPGHHGPHAMCEEAEALVEFYLQEISESLASLHLTRQQIDNTESLLMLRLDMARNSLLTITTIISLMSMCLALGSCVAGIFGMNLRNGVEDDINWFHGVIIALVLIMMAIFFVIYFVLVRAGMLAI